MREFTASLVFRLVDRLSAPARAVARTIGSVERAQQNAQRASQQWSDRLNQLDDSLGRAARWSLVTEGLGRAGEAMMRPLRRATELAGTYEHQLLSIADTADMSVSALARLDRSIMAASRRGRAPSQVAEAAGIFVAGGITDADLLARLTDVSTKVVVGTGTAFGDAASAAMAFNLNLRVDEDQIERAFDAAATAGKAGRFELSDMAQYLPSVGAIGARRGLTGVSGVAELAAGLTVIRDQVGESSEAATYMRDLLLKMDANETTRSFERFGVDLRRRLAEERGRGRSPIDAILDITAEAQSRGAQINQLFTDQQAQLGISALIDGRARFEAVREEAVTSAGVVERSYQRMSRATLEWTRRGEAAKERLGISVGVILAPALQFAADLTERLAGWMQRVSAEGGLLGRAAVWAFAGLAGLAVGAGMVGQAIVGILGPALILRAVFGGLGRAGVGLMFARLAQGLAVARNAMIGFNLAMLANPVGLLVAAIAVAVGAIALVVRKYWQPISAFFSGMGEVIGEALAPLGAMLAPLAPIWNAITGAVGAFFGWIGRLLQPVQMTGEQLEGATDAGRIFGRHLVTAFKIVTLPLQVMVAAVRLGVAAVRAALAWNPMDTLRAAWGGISGFFGGLTDRFAGFGRAIIQGLINGIRSMLGGVRDAVMNTASSAVNWFRARLGIRSPSRVFAALGDDTMAGLAVGLTRSAIRPLGSLTALSAAMAAHTLATPALAVPAAPVMMIEPPAVPRDDGNDPTFPGRAPVAPGASTPSVVIERLENHYHINGAQDVRAIAREIARLERQGLRSALNDAVNE